MTQPTLTYFDIPTSRGEECRLGLFISDVKFTDEHLSRAQWEERKATSPFGALPMFASPGKPTLAQSNAILRMIGSQHCLLPSDAWESARHEAVMCAVEEMRAKLGPTGRIKDPPRSRPRVRRSRRRSSPSGARGWRSRPPGPSSVAAPSASPT